MVSRFVLGDSRFKTFARRRLLGPGIGINLALVDKQADGVEAYGRCQLRY